MIEDYKALIEEKYRALGIELKEDGDEVIELWQGNHRIARWRQTEAGIMVDILNTLKEIEAGKYSN